MWRPLQPVKHAIEPARWPTAAEARRARLFSPLTLGRLLLADRTWVPAMVPWRATEEGTVTADVLDWYERFAEGQPGALVVEATGVRDVRSGPLLRASHDCFVPGLARLVERVRAASEGRTRLFIQLIDFLSIKRRPVRDVFFQRYLTVTPRHRALLHMETAPEEEVRTRLALLNDGQLDAVLDDRELEMLHFGYRERVTDVDLPHIRELPQILPAAFAAAAVRAQQAGFDGVELHYAHAYTMAGFLSATNTRTDGYGGSRDERIRLPLEVYREVRRRVRPEFVVGCRFLTDEIIEGGSSLDDAAYFGVEFARAGMDFLSLSRGGKFEDAQQPRVGTAAYPYTGRSGWECMPTAIGDERGPFGRNVDDTAAVTRAVRAAGFTTPTVVAGGIHTFEQAENILERGIADIVGAARQSLADPDWFRKMRLGMGAEVRRCTFTNYCEALDQAHRQVTCKLWDRVGIDQPGVRLSVDGRRRLSAPRTAWAREARDRE
jgi:2,4-dienoyl-CoA reductase-like NADH-dependent reductase (Old Yellow Enzyme family)